MSLNIATFSNVTGGNALFKALTHPKIADNARSLLAALRAAGPVAVYDPLGHGEAFDDLYGVTGVNNGSVFVQRAGGAGRGAGGGGGGAGGPRAGARRGPAPRARAAGRARGAARPAAPGGRC